jgi:hypothetical protein
MGSDGERLPNHFTEGNEDDKKARLVRQLHHFCESSVSVAEGKTAKTTNFIPDDNWTFDNVSEGGRK